MTSTMVYKFVFGASLLLFSGLTDLIQGNDYVDFGYDVINATKTKQNGYTEISVTFKAPLDTETYWDLDGIPVIEFDRFSNIKTTRNNYIFTSRLRTTKDFGFTVMYSYSFRPYFVRMQLSFYNVKNAKLGYYHHGCSYRKPQHNDYAVTLDFLCNTDSELHTDAYFYFVRNQSTFCSRKYFFGDGRGEFFRLQTKKSDDEAISTLTPLNRNKTQDISATSIYGLHFEYRWSTGPVSDIRFQIEDDVDLDGEGSPLQGQHVIITSFFYRPLPLAETRIGSVFCEAIGNPSPSLQILRVRDDRETVPVNYPTHVFQTKYRTLKTLVINYPTFEDSGNYTCIAKSGDRETRLWMVTRFEPPPKFNNSATMITQENGEVVITLQVTGYYEFEVDCFANNVDGRQLTNELQSSDVTTDKGFNRYQTSTLTITLSPFRPTPRKVICRAFDEWTGLSIYTVEL